MNLELLLLKLFLNDTNTYSKYSKYVSNKYLGIYKKVYHALEKLKSEGKPVHTEEELGLCFHTLYPVLSASDAETFTDLLVQLKQVSIEPGQAEGLLTQLRERDVARQIAEAAVAVATGDAEASALQSAIHLLQEIPILDEEESDFVEDGLDVLAQRLELNPPYKFRLRTLNQIFGGLRKRTFGFVYARPEMGKTTFLASEATFLAPQTERGILWVNNEEDGAAIIPRLYQASLLKTSEQLYKDTGKSTNDYREKIQGKIRIYDRPTATYRDIERIVLRDRPNILLIDQIDKVLGFDAEREDLKQKAKYQWGRELAKRADCAVVGVCQAGGEAEGKRFLGLNDVDSSKTGKQGEADWMLGIGGEGGDDPRRWLSAPKNKLPAIAGMIPEMRHGKVPVMINPELQIYEDVLNVH